MFGIFFKDKDTSFDNGYGMHILASISLGEYVEELHIPIDYWGIEEYKNSWAKSIADAWARIFKFYFCMDYLL